MHPELEYLLKKNSEYKDFHDPIQLHKTKDALAEGQTIQIKPIGARGAPTLSSSNTSEVYFLKESPKPSALISKGLSLELY